MDAIDFRSDTVSWPTTEMREAMARAPVGDDVYGEDPTVTALEDLAAETVGMEAGLFVTSGTQGNLAALLTHVRRGEEAICGYRSHVFEWEGAGMAALGGIGPHPLPTDDRGKMDLGAVERAIREDDPHLPRTRLIAVENTFGGCGGTALESGYFRSIREIADRHDLRIHLDGARLFNAAVALDVPATELTQHVDSVTFCLSKGLCAPVGSVLCGARGFVEEARRVRKTLGGGARQVGIIAAAGLIALRSMVSRLAEDHLHAAQLAEGLAEIPGIRLDPRSVETNIVHFRLEPETGLTVDDFVERLAETRGILLGTYPQDQLRAVTHYWIGPSEVEALIDAAREILRQRLQ